MTGDPVSSDVALIRRLSTGDRDAVGAVYARFGRPLFAYVNELVADSGLAEEIVQDTFVAAWRQARQFEGRSSAASWLFGIARRQARDKRRRRQPETEPVERLETVPAERGLPEAEAIASASRQEVRTAMAALPSHLREVLLLTFAYDLSGPEIATILDVPEGTVKSRLFAARRALREKLGPGGTR